jgi:hypothetical protein
MEPKTTATDADVEAFLAGIPDEQRREDSRLICRLRLGKHSTGKACLYVKRVEDIDLDVLRELVGHSYAQTSAR